MSDTIQPAEGFVPVRALEESPGVLSSKRLFGAISMSLGLAMKASFGVLALLPIIPAAEVATRISVALGAADGVLWAGMALLGITVFEGLGNKIGGAA